MQEQLPSAPIRIAWTLVTRIRIFDHLERFDGIHVEFFQTAVTISTINIRLRSALGVNKEFKTKIIRIYRSRDLSAIGRRLLQRLATHSGCGPEPGAEGGVGKLIIEASRASVEAYADVRVDNILRMVVWDGGNGWGGDGLAGHALRCC